MGPLANASPKLHGCVIWRPAMQSTLSRHDIQYTSSDNGGKGQLNKWLGKSLHFTSLKQQQTQKDVTQIMGPLANASPKLHQCVIWRSAVQSTLSGHDIQYSGSDNGGYGPLSKWMDYLCSLQIWSSSRQKKTVGPLANASPKLHGCVIWRSSVQTTLRWHDIQYVISDSGG